VHLDRQHGAFHGTNSELGRRCSGTRARPSPQPLHDGDCDNGGTADVTSAPLHDRANSMLSATLSSTLVSGSTGSRGWRRPWRSSRAPGRRSQTSGPAHLKQNVNSVILEPTRWWRSHPWRRVRAYWHIRYHGDVGIYRKATAKARRPSPAGTRHSSREVASNRSTDVADRRA
jgi:hypothetical protein